VSNHVLFIFTHIIFIFFCLTDNKERDPSFVLPKTADLLKYYKKFYEGDKLVEEHRNSLYFFLVDMMDSISRNWMKTDPDHHSQRVTTSDLAFGLFLLAFYGDSVPSIEVLKRESPREKRKRRLDGQELNKAVLEYSKWNKIFKEIQTSKSTKRHTRSPLQEMDNELVMWIQKEEQGKEEVKKKSKKTSPNKINAEFSSVQDFFALGDLPVEE
jgi:hypothetical protein